MGRKRLRFKTLPRPAYPVRALWELASEEERQRAHQTCVGILEWWLGKSSRSEVAAKLELPPLRVWQLGQQALAGMLAGLLRQPRTRPKPGSPPIEAPRVEVATLRKEIARLKKKLEVAEELNSVLRELKTATEARPKRATRKPPDFRPKARKIAQKPPVPELPAREP